MAHPKVGVTFLLLGFGDGVFFAQPFGQACRPWFLFRRLPAVAVRPLFLRFSPGFAAGVTGWAHPGPPPRFGSDSMLGFGSGRAPGPGSRFRSSAPFSGVLSSVLALAFLRFVLGPRVLGVAFSCVFGGFQFLILSPIGMRETNLHELRGQNRVRRLASSASARRVV